MRLVTSAGIKPDEADLKHGLLQYVYGYNSAIVSTYITFSNLLIADLSRMFEGREEMEAHEHCSTFYMYT